MGSLAVILIGIGIFLLILIISGIKFVPQAQIYVVERVGAFSAVVETGPHYILHIFNKIGKKELRYLRLDKHNACKNYQA